MLCMAKEEDLNRMKIEIYSAKGGQDNSFAQVKLKDNRSGKVIYSGRFLSCIQLRNLTIL